MKSPPGPRRRRKVFALAAVVILVGALGLLLVQHRELIAALTDGGETLKQEIVALGPRGPIAVALLMIVAVVFSPIPSAPIAVASGALYGHGWGALYVLVGAQLGAMICFGLARGLGYDAIHRMFGEKLKAGLLGSQRTLGYSVVISRLLPFISFDIVSYAAGLTVIRFWRFSVATLIGIAPSSFLLAHLGAEASTGELERIGVTVLLLGLVTAIPFIAVKFARKNRDVPPS